MKTRTLTPSAPKRATLRIGQAVPFDKATDGWAQIEELLRTNVIVRYKRDGRLCRRRVPGLQLARAAAERPLMIEMDNPLDLAIRQPRAKEFHEGAPRYGYARTKARSVQIGS